MIRHFETYSKIAYSIRSLLRTPFINPTVGSKSRNIYKSLQGWLALDPVARAEFTKIREAPPPPQAIKPKPMQVRRGKSVLLLYSFGV